jgi:hypothetical protein
MPSSFQLNERDGITILTVTVAKFLMLDDIQPVMREVERLMSETTCRLVVDLSACTYQNGAFAVRMKQIKTKYADSQLMLCGVHEAIVEMFTFLSFEQETPITASLEQMCKFLQQTVPA